MGYTLELWAVPLDRLVDELAHPSLPAAAAVEDDTVPAEVSERWDDLAATVAGVIRDGGGELGGALAVYVHVVVRMLGTFYGALDHTSAGGPEFRRCFLPGPAGDRLGIDFVAARVNRSLAGLTWSDYPVIGWATVDELREAAARADGADGTKVAPEDVEPLEALTRAVRHAVHVGVDLVSVYG